jgi:ABC-2 type transport system permease protein
MEAESLSRAQRIALEPLEPIDRDLGPFRATGRSVREIWANRELLYLLVRRELKARYKNSSLGVVWSLFRPLVQLLIYYFAIGQILGAARFIPDFEIFPLSAVGGALFNFAVQLLVLLVAIGLLSTFPADVRLLLAPLAIVTLIVFSIAVGLVLSAWNVYLRDTEHFVEIALVILFWLSPIVYSYTFVHDTLGGTWMEQLYLANPVTIVIIAMQKALWNAGSTATGDLAQEWPADLELRLAITLLVSIVLLWLAQRLFSRLQGNFAQEL